MPWLDAAASFDRALRCHPLDVSGPVDSEEHLAAIVLDADPDARADLRARVNQAAAGERIADATQALGRLPDEVTPETAAITRDVDQVPIIVVRHDNNMMTVYAGLDDVAVQKGQKVGAGTALGKARSQGVVHFEVRNGFDSVDPEKYLN